MKATSCLLPRLALLLFGSAYFCAVGQSATTPIFSENFESYSAGSNLSGQGGWTVSGVATGDYVVITSDAFHTGRQSLYIADNGTSSKPKAVQTLSETLNEGVISFAIKAGSDTSPGTLRFGTFSLVWTGTTINLSYSGGGEGTQPTVKQVPYATLTDRYSWSATGWNVFSIAFDKATGKLEVSLNGTLTATGWNTGFSITSTAYNWTVNRFEFESYSNAGTGAFYLDSISIATTTIPEPSALSVIFGAASIFILGIWVACRRPFRHALGQV